MKRYSFLAFLVAFVLIGTSCNTGAGTANTDTTTQTTTATTTTETTTTDTTDDSTSGSTTSSTVDTTAYTVSVAATAAASVTGYDPADLVANTTFASTVAIDLSALTAQEGTGTPIAIGTTAAIVAQDSDAGTNIAIEKTAYGVTITSTTGSPVKYVLSGSFAGTLSIASAAAYELYLDGVNIAATAGPALDLESTAKAFIVSAPGTTNALTDSSTRSMTMKAALFGKGPIVFSGTGSLTVTGSYKHGIFSNDSIRVVGGTIAVNVSAKDAIRSVNGFIFDDGNLTISATGTTTDDESKGIKVEGDESETGAGKGHIIINGGTISITSVSKGITASFDTDEDGDTTSTEYEPNPYLRINNGVISVRTTGTPYEKKQADGTTVSCSPEGIESKTDLAINGGYLTIATADDCINAGTSITINGGYLYCMSSDNDAIDSNGTMTINGGVIVAGGSTVPEEGFDCDSNTFTITGGTFVGIAGATSVPTASVCTQNSVILGAGTANSLISIRSSSGDTVFAFLAPRSYSVMLLSAPAINSSTAYTVYSGGTATGTSAHYGLYLGTVTATGGTAGSTFTTDSRVTNLATNNTIPGRR